MKFTEAKAEVKAEVKAELMEVRKNDMYWIQQRFNTIEKYTAGKVVSEQKNFEDEITK